MKYKIGAFDKRCVRNVTRFRNFLLSIHDERKAGEKFFETDHGDMMSMLMKDELYKDKPEMIIDDVMGIFAAGMLTINISSSNVVMWQAYLPEVGKKLVAEIDSNLEPIADNLLEKFTIEVTEEFSYLLKCYHETLRTVPPAPITTSTVFTQEVTLGGVTIREGDALMLNLV